MEMGISASVPDVPCHCQAVERLLKIITEASARESDVVQRKRVVLAKISSRSRTPVFNSKRD